MTNVKLNIKKYMYALKPYITGRLRETPLTIHPVVVTGSVIVLRRSVVLFGRRSGTV